MIHTRDLLGKLNGRLLPIWNALERPDLRPDQVYLTTVLPHSVKGPHLHMKRRGLFCCVRGDARIVVLAAGVYFMYDTGDLNGNPLVEVPAGLAAAIYNNGDDEAFVLNMPSPAWSTDDPDEWPVEKWNYVG